MAGADGASKAVAQRASVQEIELARADLARTIDAIADRVSPANVARRGAGRLLERARAVDPRLAAGAAVAAAGVVALVVWRRRR